MGKQHFGITINRNLNIDEYIFDLSQKAGRKLSILAGLWNQNFERRRTLVIAFVDSQFGFPWMFHGRKANSEINHIHEKGRCIV